MNGFNLTAILQIITTLVIAIIGFFIKRELKKLEDADNENKRRINTLEKDVYNKMGEFKDDCKRCNCESLERLNEFKEDVGKEFVRKSDYIQTTSEIMKRLDKIYDMLYELRGNTRGG